MQKICLVGASGRMGSAIVALLPTCIETRQYSRLNAENINQFSQDLQTCDGVIDISHTDNIQPSLNACLKAKKPYFCGTTGLTQAHFDALQAAGKTIPVLYAANTSFGIAILKKAVALVSKAFGKNTEITISEVHHRFKKDAPSGAALELGKIIAQSGYPHDAINFTSVRGGNVTGKHMVHFFHGDEIVSLNHECLNRNVFADGAIKAAQWLFKQPLGFYSMNDVLELK